MVPDLVVPDLEGCELKPYVPYNTQDIYQDSMTAQVCFMYINFLLVLVIPYYERHILKVVDVLLIDFLMNGDEMIYKLCYSDIRGGRRGCNEFYNLFFKFSVQISV